MRSRRLKARLSQISAAHLLRDVPLLLSRRSSYAQHGEDAFLRAEVLAGRPGPGTYVDIGASHPVRISNTYLFYRMGWSGITVEPLSTLARLHRLWRPRDTLVEAIVGEADGEAVFHRVSPAVLSTTSAAELERNRARGAILIETTTIRQMTLGSILALRRAGGRVDLLSVDVEGADHVIAGQVAALPSEARPHAICIERNDPATAAAVDGLLGPLYRRRHEIACNAIFWDPS